MKKQIKLSGFLYRLQTHHKSENTYIYTRNVSKKYLLNCIWYENFLLSLSHWQSVNLSWFIACFFFHKVNSCRLCVVMMRGERDREREREREVEGGDGCVNIIRLCEQFVRKLNNNLETRRQRQPHKSQRRQRNFPKWKFRLCECLLIVLC